MPGLAAAGPGLGAVIAPLADIVLASVPKREAGSASGVFNTGLQLGNSIGIALIGVIFFGMLGSQAGPAASTVTPQLRAGLAAAGLPASYTGRVVHQFRGCLHDRLVAADPTVTPAACRPTGPAKALPPAAHQALAQAGGSAVRTDFAASVERTLWFQVGVFLLSFLLMFVLPAGAGRHPADPPEAVPDGAQAAQDEPSAAREGAAA